MPVDEKTYFEHLYKEYSALSTRIDTYATGSFDDIKLLGAVGSVIAWQPIWKKFKPTDSSMTLFIGFAVILLIVTVLEYWNLLKLSLIRFYMARMVEAEKELLELANRSNVQSFHVGRKWATWSESMHRSLSFQYQVLYYGTVAFIPPVSLYMTTEKAKFALGYLLLAGCLFASLLLALAKLRRDGR